MKEDLISIDLGAFLTPAAVLLSGLMIAASLFFGLKVTKSPDKDNASGSEIEEVLPAEKTQPAQEPTPRVPPTNQKAKTSIDDDAVMGNKETAKIAIVEFSDYECPFCERFWSQTLPRIKENYVDTGKAIFVYRDLPLDFHDPAATREANAAECAGELGGDEIFYQFHDKIYEKTPGNGAGISEDDLVEIGTGLGLNKENLTKCIQDEEFAEEIRKDAADARSAGISGTPGFVIGKLGKDGSVEGTLIRGAQPYSNFEQAINEQLGK